MPVLPRGRRRRVISPGGVGTVDGNGVEMQADARFDAAGADPGRRGLPLGAKQARNDRGVAEVFDGMAVVDGIEGSVPGAVGDERLANELGLGDAEAGNGGLDGVFELRGHSGLDARPSSFFHSARDGTEGPSHERRAVSVGGVPCAISMHELRAGSCKLGSPSTNEPEETELNLIAREGTASGGEQPIAQYPQPPLLVALPGDEMDADDAAWTLIADAADAAVMLPGLSSRCQTSLRRLAIACDVRAGRLPGLLGSA